MSNYWNKKEEETLKEHFETMKWEELLDNLPNKTESQILRKASKMGMKRENELLEQYYDEERKGWVEKYRYFLDSNTICFVNGFLPSPQGSKIEDIKERFSEKFTTVFYEIYIKNQYYDFLSKLGLDHNDDLFNFFWDMRKRRFFNEDFPEYEERVKQVEESIKKQILEQKTTKQ